MREGLDPHDLAKVPWTSERKKILTYTTDCPGATPVVKTTADPYGTPKEQASPVLLKKCDGRSPHSAQKSSFHHGILEHFMMDS